MLTPYQIQDLQKQGITFCEIEKHLDHLTQHYDDLQKINEKTIEVLDHLENILAEQIEIIETIKK